MRFRDLSLKNISIFISIAIMSVVLIYTSMSLFAFDTNQDEKQIVHLQEVIEKALIQCYALEGAYPPNIEYLRDNYGIILDEDKYIFHYEIYMSNILPMVMILENDY